VLTHVDLCGTAINHPFPLPERLVDMVLACPEFLPMCKGTAAKLFATDVGYSETIGTRVSMEDTLVLMSGPRFRVYGVVDGHGGSGTAHVLARGFASAMNGVNFSKLGDIRAVCDRLEQLVAKRRPQGGAVFAFVVIARRKLAVANLGDCRVLRIKRDGTVVQLTVDHKACERREMEMVKKNGSFVANERVEGHLAVTRSFGDLNVRGLGRTPDVRMVALDADDWRFVIACDGVFDVLENERVAKIVSDEPDVHRAAAAVKHAAIASRSSDNVSVVVIGASPRKAPVREDK
jgi:serine/threonine protein phosphatase PrpC